MFAQIKRYWFNFIIEKYILQNNTNNIINDDYDNNNNNNYNNKSKFVLNL